jgi:dihydrolipoamide dehydrogenase
VSRIDLAVPDLGGFEDVPVIDVLVALGDSVEVDTPLITLETEKASMDVPAVAAGKIVEVLLRRGEKVSTGTVIARIEADQPSPSATAPSVAAPRAEPAAPPAASAERGDAARTSAVRVAEAAVKEEEADRATGLLVLGAGPAGYTAAFRAADLGLASDSR